MNLFDLAPRQPPLSKKAEIFDFKEIIPIKPLFEDEIDETSRIIKLPEQTEYNIDLSWIYTPKASITLRPIQLTALQALYSVKGLLGPIPVGHGKTLIAHLAPLVLGAKKTVILMPSNMVEAFSKETEKYKSSFQPVQYTILPYSILSSPKSSDILGEINPDLIVADEAHTLAAKNSSRAIRFRRYMKEHPETHFAAMSGTFFRKSILDLAPLAFFALRHLSPLPNDKEHAEIWSACLDVDGRPTGAQWEFFNRFCISQGIDISNMIGEERQENAREACYRRMAKTPGLVSTHLSSVDVGLTIELLKIDVPEDIVEAFKIVEEGETPDHEDIIVDDVQKARITKNLSCGFYYRWAWEQIGGRDEDWLLRRKLWSRELRRELLYHNTTHYDSPLLVTNAVANDTDHPLYQSWAQWLCVKHKPVPPTIPVWINKFLVLDALDRLNSVPTIVWYSSAALEDELQKYMPVYGAGSSIPEKIETCAMSINVHGTGKNLQAWNRNLVLEPPSSAVKWEQLIGRTHRAGQEKDVEFLVYSHTEYLDQVIAKAIEQAEFIHSIQKSPQKLLMAKWR